MSRDYDNSNRTKQAARTAVRILEATEASIREKSLTDVTLGEIADRAEVSVQTVIRKFSGWDGLLEALAERVGERIRAQRGAVEPGDVVGAVDNVLEHYESEGDLVLRLLSAESTSEFAATAAASGRAYHRNWVEAAFGPLLREREPTQIDALVVATDLYTWRLLRRDLGRSLDETRSVMLHLVQSTLGEH